MIEGLLAGLFGLLIGSFLNVCIYRLPRDLSVWRPSRSFCPQCQRRIAWFDNIPLVSYVLLGGKCRQCAARIPLRYPIVEALTGILFFLCIYKFGASAAGLKHCLFSALMVGLVFADLEERILPDEFTIGGTMAGLILSQTVLLQPGVLAIFLPPDLAPRWISLAESAFGAFFTSGSLWAVGFLYEQIRKREGLGFGDVKMIAMIGSFYGLMPTLLTLMVGSLFGALLGIGFIQFKGYDMGSYELPFGTFLGAAALVVAFLA